MDPVSISESAKWVKRGNGIEKGKIYRVLESNIKENIGLLSLGDLIKIVDNLLPENIGSTYLQS